MCTVRVFPSASIPTASAVPRPCARSDAPTTSSSSEASGDGALGSTTRSQLRFTSAAVSGVPSENARPSRSVKTTVRPPSANVHDSARAGRTVRSASTVVRLSNTCAITAALAASPAAAGSRVAGAESATVTSSGDDVGQDGGGGRGDPDRRGEVREHRPEDECDRREADERGGREAAPADGGAGGLRRRRARGEHGASICAQPVRPRRGDPMAEKVAPTAGIEPATPALGRRRSVR